MSKGNTGYECVEHNAKEFECNNLVPGLSERDIPVVENCFRTFVPEAYEVPKDFESMDINDLTSDMVETEWGNLKENQAKDIKVYNFNDVGAGCEILAKRLGIDMFETALADNFCIGCILCGFDRGISKDNGKEYVEFSAVGVGVTGRTEDVVAGNTHMQVPELALLGYGTFKVFKQDFLNFQRMYAWGFEKFSDVDLEILAIKAMEQRYFMLNIPKTKPEDQSQLVHYVCNAMIVPEPAIADAMDSLCGHIFQNPAEFKGGVLSRQDKAKFYKYKVSDVAKFKVTKKEQSFGEHNMAGNEAKRLVDVRMYAEATFGRKSSPLD